MRRDYQNRIVPLLPAHLVFLTSLIKGEDIACALAEVATRLQRPSDQIERAWTEPTGRRESWIAVGLFMERDGTH